MNEKQIENKLTTAVKKSRPLQLSRHRLLQELGYRVYVIDDPAQIGGMIDELQST